MAERGAARGRPWFWANEVLAFCVEVAALGFLAWWGYAVGGGGAVGALLAVLVLAAAITLWGLIAAPRARFRAPPAGVPAVKALVLLGSACALFAVGHRAAAAAFAVVVIVNTALAETFRRR